MITSPIDSIISDAQANLSEKIKAEVSVSDENVPQVFTLGKKSFIRLLESEASAGHFDEFLKVYNGTASSLSVAQITSLLEYFYAKNLREDIKLSDMNAGKVSKIVAPFIIKKINTNKTEKAKDIPTLCKQMGLESCATNLEALKARWDSLSPEEKKQFSR